ncbi:hypothetical protein BSNK01_26460 [Bacillaceae bacterium]
MKILYLDCFSGISGDMTVGALIDAGADPHVLREELRKLDLETEYSLSWRKVVRNGISATKFDVILENGETPAHHGTHGRHHDHDHNHDHEHDHNHNHHHDHENKHEHVHDRKHRRYREIVELIENAKFNANVTATALRIFERIGRAEAKIHAIPLEKVHFHEVGAVDSIIDIVGTAIALDMLNISQVVASPVPLGSGTIHIDHGCYPVPAPATLEILKGVPLAASELAEELTTPTGAGILAALSRSYGPIPPMRVEAIGYGAGTKDFPSRPNVLRAIIGTL